MSIKCTDWTLHAAYNAPIFSANNLNASTPLPTDKHVTFKELILFNSSVKSYFNISVRFFTSSLVPIQIVYPINTQGIVVKGDHKLNFIGFMRLNPSVF